MINLLVYFKVLLFSSLGYECCQVWNLSVEIMNWGSNSFKRYMVDDAIIWQEQSCK